MRLGKEVRRSLSTTDRATAKRKPADLYKEVDRTEVGATHVTLADLYARDLATIRDQCAKTLKRKRHITARVIEDFPGGADGPAGKVMCSQASTWLASYDFGKASYNLFLEYIRAVFALAVADRVIVYSPVEGIKIKKRDVPIRKTPSAEDFRAIVASIRGQQYADTARHHRKTPSRFLPVRLFNW